MPKLKKWQKIVRYVLAEQERYTFQASQDETAARAGLGHWTCISRTSNCVWERDDGEVCVVPFDGRSELLQALRNYDDKNPVHKPRLKDEERRGVMPPVSTKDPSQRTVGEVMAERQGTGNGCCERYCDNQACNCLAVATIYDASVKVAKFGIPARGQN